MKGEAEIRAHRDALLVCMAMPCRCKGTRHEVGCLVDMKMVDATVETLSWALGENPGLQKLVDETGQGAAAYLAKRAWNVPGNQGAEHGDQDIERRRRHGGGRD